MGANVHLVPFHPPSPPQMMSLISHKYVHINNQVESLELFSLKLLIKQLYNYKHSSDLYKS